jgi:hypothetical protein
MIAYWQNMKMDKYLVWSERVAERFMHLRVKKLVGFEMMKERK